MIFEPIFGTIFCDYFHLEFCDEYLFIWSWIHYYDINILIDKTKADFNYFVNAKVN